MRILQSLAKVVQLFVNEKDSVDLKIVAGMISRYELDITDGGHWSMLCPFHKEETPSFLIDGNTGNFRCLSCSKTGSWHDLVDIKERFL